MGARAMATGAPRAVDWATLRRWWAAVGRRVASFARRRRTAHDLERGDVAHLVALLRRGGCPICRGVEEALARWAFWFLYEGYGESVWISRLCASGGFCPSHFWALARARPVWPLSHVGQYLLADALRSLPGARRRAWRVARRRPEECPGCEEVAWWERGLVSKLVAAQHQPAVRQALAAANALCARHLRQALAWGADPALLPLRRIDDAPASERPGGRPCVSP